MTQRVIENERERAYHTVCMEGESLQGQNGVVGLNHHITYFVLKEKERQLFFIFSSIQSHNYSYEVVANLPNWGILNRSV